MDLFKVRKWELGCKTLQRAWMDIDKFLLQDMPVSGSTMCIGLVVGDRLFVINTGDSRMVMMTEQHKIVFRTKDHRPWMPHERARVEKAGSFCIVR
jgi:protein phosphatase 2C family protein 2/3